MMPNAKFYDNPESLQEDEIIRKKQKVTRRTSLLQKVKRTLSLDKTDDCKKMESLTISRLMAQSLSISHRILYSSQANLAPEEERTTEQTTERTDIFYSAPAVVIRRKSFKGKTAEEKFDRPFKIKKKKSISSLNGNEEERVKDEDIDKDKDKDAEEHDQNHIKERVLKYERLSFRGFEHLPSEMNVKEDDCDKCRQSLSRKLSIKPKPGTVKSLVKKFEFLDSDRTSATTKFIRNSVISSIIEDYEGEQNTQEKTNSMEDLKNDDFHSKDNEEEMMDANDFGLNLFDITEEDLQNSEDIALKTNTDDPPIEDSPSSNQENNDSEEIVSEIVKEVKRRSKETGEQDNDDDGAFSERDSIYSDAGDDVFQEHVELRKYESTDSGFSSYKRPNQVNSDDSHRLSGLSNESNRMSVDSDNISNSVGSYECDDDENDLNLVDDFPSSEEEGDKAPVSPFGYLKPLYQFYSRAADAAARARIARSVLKEEEAEENLQTQIRPHALDLIENNTRIFWKDVPAVQESGHLTTLTSREKKKQEAKFEILISEASYVKSLQVLEKHYMKNLHYLAKSSHFFTERDYKSLFGNITEVRKCSENFLHDLNKHWQNDILLNDIYDIIRNHATNSFRTYIRYSTQFLNMTLKYNEIINEKQEIKMTLDLLCKHQTAKNLPLDSFLALPIQRITRFPLLMNNVLQYTDENSKDYKTGIELLRMLKKLAQECDDEIEKKKRTEEMLLISQQIDFLPEVRWIPILKSSRYLVLQTKVQQLMFRDKAMRKLGLQLFLFDDILLITKKSADKPVNEEHWSVIDYCNRELVRAEAMDKLYLLGIPELAETNAISLTSQSNYKGEKSEMVVSFQKLSDRERWLAALTPSSSDSLRKTLAAEPDCIQVTAINNYKASRPDELSIWIGDVVNVIGEPMEGWCRGEKLRNGKIGWFPKNCVVEIKDEHVKKANMKLKKEMQRNTEQYQQALDRKISLFESYA